MIIIKKYRNRRLYDTSSSRYVKLEDVADMVRKGVEFEVTDVNSGENITRSVLTQIIVEGSRDNDQGLPIEFLRQMITVTGRGRHELMSKYSSFVSGIYQRAQEELRERFQQDGQGENPGFVNPLDWFQRYVQPEMREGFWSRKDSSATQAAAPTPTAPESPSKQANDAVAELNALRAKLEAIEKSLQAAAPETSGDDASKEA